MNYVRKLYYENNLYNPYMRNRSMGLRRLPRQVGSTAVPLSDNSTVSLEGRPYTQLPGTRQLMLVSDTELRVLEVGLPDVLEGRWSAVEQYDSLIHQDITSLEDPEEVKHMVEMLIEKELENDLSTGDEENDDLHDLFDYDEYDEEKTRVLRRSHQTYNDLRLQPSGRQDSSHRQLRYGRRRNVLEVPRPGASQGRQRIPPPRPDRRRLKPRPSQRTHSFSGSERQPPRAKIRSGLLPQISQVPHLKYILPRNRQENEVIRKPIKPSGRLDFRTKENEISSSKEESLFFIMRVSI